MDAFTKWLLQDAGTWDADVSVFVANPVSHSKGVLVAEAVADRWLRTRFINETSGFNGAGLYGWDSIKNKPVAQWVDTQTTFLVVGEGEFAGEGAGAVAYSFSADIPGKGPLSWREVHKRISADEKTFDSFFKVGDGEKHVMTIHYRRRR